MNQTKVLLVGIYDTNTVSLAPELLRAYAEQFDVACDYQIATLHLSLFADTVDGMERRIMAHRPAIVGLSSYVWNHEAVRQLAGRLPARVVVGGPMVQADDPDLFARHPGLDVAVVGEGEETFEELLEVWSGRRPLESVAGIRTAHLTTPPRRPLAELDRLPSPYPRIFAEHGDLEWIAFETSRGCPHRCGYCTWGRSKGMRFHSLDRVVRDLDRLLDRPELERIYLCDSCLLVDPARAKKILRHVVARAAPTAIRYEFRPEQLDDELVDLLVALPAHELNLGLQSINPAALSTMQRRFSPAEFERAYRRLAARAPDSSITLDLIYGLPGDDLAGYEASLEYAMSLERVDWILTNPLLLLPGSDFHRRRGELGIRLRDEESLVVAETATFSAAEMREAIRLSFWVAVIYFNRRLRQAVRQFATDSGQRYVDVVRGLFEGADRWIVDDGRYPYMIPSSRDDFRRRNEAIERVARGYPALVARFDERTGGAYRARLGDFADRFAPQYERLRRLAAADARRRSARASSPRSPGGSSRSAPGDQPVADPVERSE